MAGSSLAESFTTTVSAASFTIADGYAEIFINNIGAGDASFVGTYTDPASGTASTSITIPSGQSFSLGYIGRGRKGFTIDATATVVEICATN